MSSVEVAAEQLRCWRENPSRFVRDVFDVTPDTWQDEVLTAFPHHQRIAMKACKGPGKTAVEAWLAWNFLLTRPHPKIAATSITADNLSANLWTELAKWQHKSPLLLNAFRWMRTRIESRQHPETWWADARTWPRSASAEQQANTLAGLHADYILFILDESGGIPDAVMVAAEAALAVCVEGHVLQAGNPTHREGPLYRACTSSRRLWHVVEITGDPDDPRRSTRVSAEWAREQIEQHGRDNPWVLVNVFGQFPPGSINTLIGPDDITAATLRSYGERDIAMSPRILGIDVAREGDDASVIWPRQGLVAFTPLRYRNIDGIQGAGTAARKWTDWDADAAFVDNSGGFGASWIDNLHLLGKAPIPVGFSEKANDARYFNKRAEIYLEAAEWIKRGGQLPPMTTSGMPELTAAFTRTTYSFRGDKLLVEPKELVKAKLGYSPDDGDAFALTFSHPVSARGRADGRRAQHQTEYDPFASVLGAAATRRAMQTEYDPFRR